MMKYSPELFVKDLCCLISSAENVFETQPYDHHVSQLLSFRTQGEHMQSSVALALESGKKSAS